MRRPLVLLLIVLLVLGGGSYALWSWAVGRMQAGYDAWVQQAAAQGWAVHAASVRRTGWPAAAELAIDGLSLTAGPEIVPGGAGWSVKRVVMHLSPLAPDVLEVRLSGEQHVRALRGPAIPFAAESFVFAVPLPGPGPVQLTARKLRFGAPVAGMTVGLLTGEGRQDASAVDFTLSAEAIALPPPPAPQPALGRGIASATITGALDGPWPPVTLDAAARAAAWQKAGGMLRVTHLAMGWGPLGITGSAALGLDPSLQPQGTGTVRVIGYERALSALAAGHAITPSAAQAIRAVLALLARTPEGGGAAQVELPLALNDGVLRVGSIPVGKLRHWDWSAPQ